MLRIRELMEKHNTDTVYVVFKQSNWEEEYTEEQRTYEVKDNTAQHGLHDGKISNAIWGDCLDGVDLRVRLDRYRWSVERMYV